MTPRHRERDLGGHVSQSEIASGRAEKVGNVPTGD
jgi:hypothetical protein